MAKLDTNYRNSERDHPSFASTNTDELKRTKRRIYKNVFFVSFAFLLLFIAYGGLARLQSSLHREKGMGVITQSLLYAAMCFSCLFVSVPLIRLVGHKWTMPLCASGYILWMAANGYAVWSTMIISSIIVGICGAPLWASCRGYITKMSEQWCGLTGEVQAAVVARFFGIFGMLFAFAGIIGSLVTSMVLRPAVLANHTMDESEELTSEETAQVCGHNYCPHYNITNPNLEAPDSKTVWIMVGIYIATAGLAILIGCIFVDSIPPELLETEEQANKGICQMFMATLKQIILPSQLLLLPISMLSSVKMTFIEAEFTNAFVACSMGIWMVGFLMLPCFVASSVAAIASGTLTKYTGNIPMLITAFVVDIGVYLTMSAWPVDKDKGYVLYILSALLGVGESIWRNQRNGLYGAIFKDNSAAAFSANSLVESMFFVIAYAYSSVFCMTVKIVIATCITTLSLICCCAVIVIEKKKQRRKIMSKEVVQRTTEGEQESNELFSEAEQ